MIDVKVGDYLIKDDFIIGKIRYISESKTAYVKILYPQDTIDYAGHRGFAYWFLRKDNLKVLSEKEQLFYELKYG
jgi:hypothetical protein